MLDHQDSIADEGFIEIMKEVFTELGEFTEILLERLNDLPENDVCHKKLVIDEIKLVNLDLESLRTEIEEFLNEGFAPFGDEDDETICDILKNEGEISQYHINQLEDILILYYYYKNKIYDIIRECNN